MATSEVSATTRRSVLKSGLLGGLAVVGTTLALAPTARADAFTQWNWRWCRVCQGLFYAGFSTSQCPGGGHHDGSQSYDYGVQNFSSGSWTQGGWCWCNKCQGLFYGPYVSNSWCPASGHHNTNDGSYNYFVGMNTSGGQDGWRWCRRCQGLFYGPFTGNSICPASSPGQPTRHDGSESANYGLAIDGSL